MTDKADFQKENIKALLETAFEQSTDNLNPLYVMYDKIISQFVALDLIEDINELQVRRRFQYKIFKKTSY